MDAIHAGTRIGTLWQQRMDSLREYEVIRDGNVFGTSFSNNYVYSSEFDRAHQYLARLTEQYDGVPFDTLFPGTEVTNAGGACISITSRHSLTITPVDRERYTREVLADLTLVHGIGRATQRRLNARGYSTIEDLVLHPKFRAGAAGVLGCLSHGDSLAIMEMIGARHARSHPFVLGTAGFFEPGDYVFLDIETLGLFSRPIILFGVGTIEDHELVVHQYLLRDIEEEPAALAATIGHFSSDRPALVTFNGKAFDLPYLKDRLAYYGMGAATGIPHFDVLHFSRRRWKSELPSLRLICLEREILGVRRVDDIPGQMVPEFYEIYLRTGNCGPLVPIIEHNRQDVVSLALLFYHLLGEAYGCR
jgi:uncharacterized protein YprB with RNaseH-like and TPR domain